MFGISGCEEVTSSIFLAQRRQMKGCVTVAEQKVSDWQMNAWTLQLLYCKSLASYGG